MSNIQISCLLTSDNHLNNPLLFFLPPPLPPLWRVCDPAEDEECRAQQQPHGAQSQQRVHAAAAVAAAPAAAVPASHPRHFGLIGWAKSWTGHFNF